ncbi:DUF4190 domain-containing protein [Streptomyces morookaense]|uniref:DUF4190 domain-containing protein n=1 Tax=Streptomyces morookaense TaxID=1970 RepID=A0A7Y7E954_STRMO|nr:DUF4190 domain-containing protein [Streptomyces morookaense]NVK80056.1 DUF4190 domain-containing protein [Streptomyces morookaense]GHF41874.1 hypothetical protein GCM10010359_50700 [Streptomyces morookaense]
MKTKPPADLPALMPKSPNGDGMTALVLALLGVMIASTLWGIPLAIVLGLAATVYGVIGRGRVKRGETDERLPALIGLIVGATVAVVSLGFTAWFIYGLSHAYDSDPRQELASRGGVYEAPLGPDETARYRDGLTVTVGQARHVPNLPGDCDLRKGEETYAFTVTYVNAQKKPVDLAWNGIHDDEKLLPSGNPPHGPMSPEWDRTHPWFPDSLAPHQTVTVTMYANVVPGSTALEFTCSPTAYRDDAHWLLPLR